MTAKELIDGIRAEFGKRLEAKTGWGRKEVARELDHAIADVLVKRTLAKSAEITLDD